MFKCQKCNKQSKPGDAQYHEVVETRRVQYTNEEGLTTSGTEIVTEIHICEECHGR